MFDRRGFIGNAMAFAALGGCVSAKTRSADGLAAPRFAFGDDGEFRFLQLADLHLKPAGGKLHPRVEKTLRAAFAKFRPSLLVLTGDNVSGQDGDVNARGGFETAVDPLIGLFREHRIPFCVTFGNHDSEKKGSDRFSRQEQYDYYKARGGDCFVDHDVPELHGVGSGVVSLCRRGESAASFNLFVKDSGDYCGSGYDGCHADQIAWYERVSGTTHASGSSTSSFPT